MNFEQVKRRFWTNNRLKWIFDNSKDRKFGPNPENQWKVGKFQQILGNFDKIYNKLAAKRRVNLKFSNFQKNSTKF